LGGRAFIEQIEISWLRTDAVEPEFPAAFENLLTRSFKWLLILTAVAHLLNRRRVTDLAFRRGSRGGRGRSGTHPHTKNDHDADQHNCRYEQGAPQGQRGGSGNTRISPYCLAGDQSFGPELRAGRLTCVFRP